MPEPAALKLFGDQAAICGRSHRAGEARSTACGAPWLWPRPSPCPGSWLPLLPLSWGALPSGPSCTALPTSAHSRSPLPRCRLRPAPRPRQAPHLLPGSPQSDQPQKGLPLSQLSQEPGEAGQHDPPDGRASGELEKHLGRPEAS